MHPRRATEPTITDARLAIAKSELALKEKLGSVAQQPSVRAHWLTLPSSVFPWKDDIPNPTSAMIYYREACRMVPSNPVYHFRLGLCYCRSGIEVRSRYHCPCIYACTLTDSICSSRPSFYSSTWTRPPRSTRTSRTASARWAKRAVWILATTTTNEPS